MKKGLTCYSLLLLILLCIGCKPNEKQKELDTIEKSTYTYRTFDNDSLMFDYYRPNNSDKKLPLLVYVHGGGFVRGSRDSKNTIQFAENIAKQGYAVVSVSYRLTMADVGFNCSTKATEKIKAFNAASEDISFAVNYILKNISFFNIDTSKIVISGESAGAESVLNLVYTYKSDILPRGFKFAGIISRAGALTSLKNITADSAVPIQLFHGTDDLLVPYNFGPHHNCELSDAGYLELYGSRAIANHYKTLDKPYYLITLNKGKHGMRKMTNSTFNEEVLKFLDTFIVNNKAEQIELIFDI